MAVRLHKSIAQTPLCRRVFKRCNFTYNWVYNLRDWDRERATRDYLDLDIGKVLQSVRKVIYRPEIDEKSVLIMNHGLHFVLSTNFSNYQKLVKGVINLFKEKIENANGQKEFKFKGKLIWKTTTAINRERMLKPHHHGGRFLTPEVSRQCLMLQRNASL